MIKTVEQGLAIYKDTVERFLKERSMDNWGSIISGDTVIEHLAVLRSEIAVMARLLDLSEREQKEIEEEIKAELIKVEERRKGAERRRKK